MKSKAYLIIIVIVSIVVTTSCLSTKGSKITSKDETVRALVGTFWRPENEKKVNRIGFLTDKTCLIVYRAPQDLVIKTGTWTCIDIGKAKLTQNLFVGKIELVDDNKLILNGTEVYTKDIEKSTQNSN